MHKNAYNYDDVIYINNLTKVDILCKQHGIFKQTPKSHLIPQGCPKCYKSTSELIIEKILEENSINYNFQYSFDDLKYIRLLRFDYGILDKNNNLLFLIEYNGIQHFKFVKHFHVNVSGFENEQMRDKLKKEYCIRNNIFLYNIKYTENIEDKIIEILKKFNLFE